MSAQQQAALPKLREDLHLLRGAPTITGRPTWLIFDPVAHRYFQIDQDAFRLLSIWNRHHSSDELLAAAHDDFGATMTDRRIAEISSFIDRNNLVVAPASGNWRDYCEKAKRRDSSWLQLAAHSYLFFRIPLVRPRHFLKVLLPVAEPLFTRGFLLFAAIVGVIGIYLTSRQWDAFLATFADFYSLGGIAAYLMALVVIKIIHELAHALMATRFGCRVPSMGLAFLVMMPVLYTDVTDAWKLTSRRQRLLIAGAGMMSELVLAALATFLWAFLPEGTVKSVCFIVATTSWVLSLAVNLNPFMRFDGYYLTADAVGIENLQPRSFELGRWKLREMLFSLGAPCPEILPRRTIGFLIAYAWATWIYRLFLFIGIALLVYFLFFKTLGVILFAIEIAWFVARPVASELSEWYKMKDTILKRRRTYVAAALAGGVVTLGLLPLSTSIEVPAVAEAKQFERIYPVAPAQVMSVNIDRDQIVSKGDVLLVLEAPELDNELRLTSIRLASVETRLRQTAGSSEDKQQVLVLQRERESLLAKQAGLQRQIRQLTVTAPFDGRIVDIRPQLHVGLWVGRDQPVLTVAEAESRLARGYLAERDLWRLAPGAKGKFIPDDVSQPKLDVEVGQIAYSNSPRLELPYLASTYNGPVSVNQTSERDLVPVEAQYMVTMQMLDDAPASRPVQRGVVRVEGKPESVLSGLWRQTLKVLVRESGV